jgi:hypothetical protein
MSISRLICIFGIMEAQIVFVNFTCTIEKSKTLGNKFSKKILDLSILCRCSVHAFTYWANAIPLAFSTSARNGKRSRTSVFHILSFRGKQFSSVIPTKLFFGRI